MLIKHQSPLQQPAAHQLKLGLQGDRKQSGPTCWFQKVFKFVLNQKDALVEKQYQLNRAREDYRWMQSKHANLHRDHQALADAKRSLQEQLTMVTQQLQVGPREVKLQCSM